MKVDKNLSDSNVEKETLIKSVELDCGQALHLPTGPVDNVNKVYLLARTKTDEDGEVNLQFYHSPTALSRTVHPSTTGIVWNINPSLPVDSLEIKNSGTSKIFIYGLTTE